MSIFARLPFEFIIVLTLFIVAIKESIIGHKIGTTPFNAITFLIFIYLLVFKTRYTKLLTFTLFFVTWLLITTLVNYDLIKLGGYKTLVIGSLNWLMLATYFKEVNLQKLFNYIALFVILFLVVNYIFYFGHWQYIPKRISFIFAGIYTNQNTTSMILLALLSFVVVLRESKSAWVDILIALLYFTIFLTQARAALLGATPLLLFYYKSKIKYIVPYFIAIFIFSALFLGDFLERFYIKITQAGSTHRVDFWVQIIHRMLENLQTFLFGFGENRTTVDYLGHHLSVHSSYVNFLANYGFIAFLMLLSLLLFLLSSTYKKSAILVVALASLLIHGLFETVLFLGFKITWVTFIFLYALREQISLKEGEYES